MDPMYFKNTFYLTKNSINIVNFLTYFLMVFVFLV